MKRVALCVSSLIALAAACGGRSTDVLDDESSDETSDTQSTAGTGGAQATGGSGGAQSTAGAGGTQSTAGSGGSQSTAGSGGQGTSGTAGTAGTTTNGTATGEDQHCASQADCAGFDATFCDIFVTGSCLVSGCSVAPDSCSTGKECCDLTEFGLPTLCIVAGACAN